MNFNITYYHLGSINLIVDGSNGNVVDDLSYDSWGRNRNPIDWSYSNITLSSVTDRGYTSHEQLSNFGLINMNGRIYDPMTLGFLSPDPFVQNPSNSQNYNRFSYVLNNPLKYVDPSGYVALNPWYEYQAGPHTKFYTYMPDFYKEYLDDQGRNWKYHGETINTPGFYGDETGMWISKLNEHNELIYSYNELRQIVQNNANSNSFFSSFSMGAGTFRVEGEGIGKTNKSSIIIGSSIDFTIATPGGGYSIEGGVLAGKKQYNQFYTHGLAYGLEASAGYNITFILPKDNFKFSDLEGIGACLSYNIGFISIAILGNSRADYPENTIFESYYGVRIGFGVGYGGSYSGQTLTTFYDWIPDISKSNIYYRK